MHSIHTNVSFQRSSVSLFNMVLTEEIFMLRERNTRGVINYCSTTGSEYSPEYANLILLCLQSIMSHSNLPASEQSTTLSLAVQCFVFITRKSGHYETYVLNKT